MPVHQDVHHAAGSPAADYIRSPGVTGHRRLPDYGRGLANVGADVQVGVGVDDDLLRGRHAVDVKGDIQRDIPPDHSQRDRAEL